MRQEIPNSLSLFDQMIRKEKNSINVTENIQEKKTLIKTIIRNKFASKQNQIKPLAITKLENGIHNIFFGNKSQKETFNETLKKIELGHKNPFINPNNKKINCSSLVYLSYKELEPNSNSRIYYKQKEALLASNNFNISKHFSVFNTNNTMNRTLIMRSPQRSVLFKNSFLTDNKTNATSNDKSQTHSQYTSEFSKYQNSKTNKKHPINLKRYFPQYNTKLNISIPFPLIKTQSNASGVLSKSTNNDSQIRYSYIDKKTKKKNRIKKEKRRLFNKLIYDKVNQLSTSRISNEKKLFEIIDRCQIIEEPINQVIKDDLEQIFDIQLKKKNKRGETKRAIIQAIKLNATKHMQLDETKAKMLELSDRINKLTDEEALVYAERIAEEYHKYNKQLLEHHYSLYDIKELKEKKKNHLKQRRNIHLNQNKIILLKNKIFQERQKFERT